jgi:hypothetical protein
MKNPAPKGFDAKKYDKKSTKVGRKIQKSTKLVSSPGINTMQRAGDILQKRVSTAKLKPMGMTYGSNKNDKGTTKHIKRAK